MTARELGIGLQSDKRPGTYAALARAAEANGIDVISVYADLMFQPPLPALLEIAEATDSVRLGPACLNPFSLHPFEIAGQVAALDLASDGRAFLGLARGTWLGAVGIEQRRSVEALEEAAGIVATLLRHDPGGYAGTTFRLAAGTTLRYETRRPAMPLLIGTWGRRAGELAGRIADEVKVGGSANPAMVAVMRRYIAAGAGAAGREPDDVGIVLGAVTVVDEDGERARARARTEVAMYLAVVAELDPTVEVRPEVLEPVRKLVDAGEHEAGRPLRPRRRARPLRLQRNTGARRRPRQRRARRRRQTRRPRHPARPHRRGRHRPDRTARPAARAQRGAIVSRLAVLIGERRDQVDQHLLGILLRRWAERAAVDVDVSLVSGPTVADAFASAAAGADGIVLDAALHGDAPIAASPVPVITVDVTNNPPGPNGATRTIYGRGIDTYVWATRHLAAWLRCPGSIIAYGDHTDQVGELRVPSGPGPHPVVVLIHGGFWHHYWERDLMDDLAIDLAEVGLATWNIEYRRGPGSWAFAIADVARAVDYLDLLAPEHRLATDRVALVGHSAGGHLALWAAGRLRHGPRDRDGAGTRARRAAGARSATSSSCAARNLGQGAAAEFLGATPEAEPDRYRALDPLQRLPVGVPTTIVQGMADGPDLIDLNRRFTARATEVGDPVELLELDGADHFDVIDAPIRRVGTYSQPARRRPRRRARSLTCVNGRNRPTGRADVACQHDSLCIHAPQRRPPGVLPTSSSGPPASPSPRSTTAMRCVPEDACSRPTSPDTPSDTSRSGAPMHGSS